MLSGEDAGLKVQLGCWILNSPAFASPQPPEALNQAQMIYRGYFQAYHTTAVLRIWDIISVVIEAPSVTLKRAVSRSLVVGITSIAGNPSGSEPNY